MIFPNLDNPFTVHPQDRDKERDSNVIQAQKEVRESTGRNHHIDAFTMWFAGGGFKPGLAYGTTDEFGFGAVENPAHVHDIHATLLHQLGLDHKQLFVRSQGLDFRLTGVEEAKVIRELLA